MRNASESQPSTSPKRSASPRGLAPLPPNSPSATTPWMQNRSHEKACGINPAPRPGTMGRRPRATTSASSTSGWAARRCCAPSGCWHGAASSARSVCSTAVVAGWRRGGCRWYLACATHHTLLACGCPHCHGPTTRPAHPSRPRRRRHDPLLPANRREHRAAATKPLPPRPHHTHADQNPRLAELIAVQAQLVEALDPAISDRDASDLVDQLVDLPRRRHPRRA